MHPVIQKARALLERLDQQAIEHETWRDEHAAALEDARIDALIAKPAPTIKQRRVDDDQLIYKVVVNERAPTQSTTMDAASSARWNEWADERIRHAVEMAAEVIGEESGRAERELRRDYDARLNEMSATISALRLELAARKKKKPNAGA
jgi:hypothetical protein